MSQTQGDARALAKALLDEVERRLFKDSLPRIRKCLSLLTPDEIWLRPNRETVSVGNLVLHLAGNVRQNIVAGLGGAPDRRNRPREFAERGPIATAELLRQLETTLEEARQVLETLDPDRLLAVRQVQGFEENAVSILVHVVEHFSYHVGQMTYFVKSRKAVDVGYYAGYELNVRNDGTRVPEPTEGVAG